jgi:hypothetical protein
MVDLVAAMGGADCEGLRAGWLAQPANALSSLSYVAAGAGLLWRDRPAGGGGRPLIPGAAGLVAVGVGSFAYHGPQPAWAGLAHDGAIAWLVFALARRGLALLRPPVAGRRGPGALAAAWRPAALWLVPVSAAYLAGRTGSSFCAPASLWQGHAAWHALSAVALALALRSRPASAGRRSRG